MTDDKDNGEAVNMVRTQNQNIFTVHSAKCVGRLDMEGEGKKN